MRNSFLAKLSLAGILALLISSVLAAIAQAGLSGVLPVPGGLAPGSPGVILKPPQLKGTQFSAPVIGGKWGQFGYLTSDSSGGRIWQIGKAAIHFYTVMGTAIAYDGTMEIPEASGGYASLRALTLSPDERQLWVLMAQYVNTASFDWTLLGIDLASRKIVRTKRGFPTSHQDVWLDAANVDGQLEIYLLNPNGTDLIMYRPAEDQLTYRNVLAEPNEVNWFAYPVGIRKSGNDLYVWDRYNSKYRYNVLELIRFDIKSKKITGGPWTTNLQMDQVIPGGHERDRELIAVGDGGRVFVTLTNTTGQGRSRVVCFNVNSGVIVASQELLWGQDGVSCSMVPAAGAVRISTNKAKFISIDPVTLQVVGRESIPADGPGIASYLAGRGTGLSQLLLSSATYNGSYYDKFTVSIVTPFAY